MKKTVQDENWERANHLVNDSGFAQNVGIRLTRLEPGYCEGILKVEQKHRNPMGTVHGGVLYTLCDTICGVAGASFGGGGSTVQSSFNFLRPGRDGVITCRARVTKNGRQLIWVECVLTDEEERELCRGEFMYIQMPGIRHFGIEPDTVPGNTGPEREEKAAERPPLPRTAIRELPPKEEKEKGSHGKKRIT